MGGASAPTDGWTPSPTGCGHLRGEGDRSVQQPGDERAGAEREHRAARADAEQGGDPAPGRVADRQVPRRPRRPASGRGGHRAALRRPQPPQESPHVGGVRAGLPVPAGRVN